MASDSSSKSLSTAARSALPARHWPGRLPVLRAFRTQACRSSSCSCCSCCLAAPHSASGARGRHAAAAGAWACSSSLKKGRPTQLLENLARNCGAAGRNTKRVYCLACCSSRHPTSCVRCVERERVSENGPKPQACCAVLTACWLRSVARWHVLVTHAQVTLGRIPACCCFCAGITTPNCLGASSC